MTDPDRRPLAAKGRNPLRDLDDRLLPTLARWVDRIVPKPPPPTGPLPVIIRMRRWDDRHTGNGPLALLREVPQLGALALAVLILVSGIVAKSRIHPQSRAGSEQGTPDDGDATDSGRLGPELGDSVPAYIDDARNRLGRAVAGQPDANAVAVVSFAGYRTVLDAQEIVGPSQIVRVFYRVPFPLPQTEARSVTIKGDLVADVLAEWRRVADDRDKAAAENLRLAATSTNDPEFKKSYEADAAIWRREAQQLRSDCACVYAVAVVSRLRVLGELLDNPSVRVVDPGRPKGRVEDYELTALLPEEKITVTGGDQEG